MRSNSPPPKPARKRRKPDAPAPHCPLVWVDPPYTPVPTAESIAALDAIAHAKQQAALKRSLPRRPLRCRIGRSHYLESDRCVPYIRLRGGWLAQAGFVAGGEVRVELLANAIVLSRIEPPPAAPAPGRRRLH